MSKKQPTKKQAKKPAPKPVKAEPKLSKKAQILVLLERPEGATLDEMMKLTNWQSHTVRGFLSMLKKGGKTIISERIKDARRYFIQSA